MWGSAAQRSLVRFRLAGIPVEVQPLFVLVVGAGAFQYRDAAGALVWMAVVTVSVLWHELGHSLAMRTFGYPPRIELHAMGGFAHWPPGARPSAREALVVSAAGPGAGLLLGAGVWGLSRLGGPLPFLANLALRDALWVNVAWSLFNLLPILPLDGGHLLDDLSRLATGAIRPRWVGWASAITGSAVVLFAMSRHEPYVALLGAFGALQGVSRIRGLAGWSRRRGSAGQGSAEAALTRARHAVSRGDPVGAIDALLPAARIGKLPEPGLAELVGLLVKAGRLDELVVLCRDRLTCFARGRDAEPLARLAADALADEDAHEQALAVAQVAFQQLAIPYHAYDAACHLARLHRDEEAVRWLGRALEAGLDGGDALLADPALDRLRRRADFLEVVGPAGARPTVGGGR